MLITAPSIFKDLIAQTNVVFSFTLIAFVLESTRPCFMTFFQTNKASFISFYNSQSSIDVSDCTATVGKVFLLTKNAGTSLVV